jgi:hypothetical protein
MMAIVESRGPGREELFLDDDSNGGHEGINDEAPSGAFSSFTLWDEDAEGSECRIVKAARDNN